MITGLRNIVFIFHLLRIKNKDINKGIPNI
jgi:hypothetical protein